MEVEFKNKEIICNKGLSISDDFVFGFVNAFKNHNIKYVIVSDYVAVLLGRERKIGDVDFLISNVTFEKFLKFWLEIENTYECLNTDDPIDAYNGYLKNYHAIRITLKRNSFPNLKIKFVKDDYERFSLKYRRTVRLGDKTLFISAPETEIPYRLSRGSEKDIEDARFLFNLFKEEINMVLLEKFLAELDIPEESFERYLGKISGSSYF